MLIIPIISVWIFLTRYSEKVSYLSFNELSFILLISWGEQVLPTLAGRWWNLERALPSLRSQNGSEGVKSIWLFNISADPYERCDLSRQRPEVVRHLMARLAHYNRTAVPVHFPPDDPRAHPDRHGGAWMPWIDQIQERDLDQDQDRAKTYQQKVQQNKKCRLCKLKAFFHKLNTRIMSSRI